MNYKTLTYSSLLPFTAVVLMACNSDPCLDDGFAKGDCPDNASGGQSGDGEDGSSGNSNTMGTEDGDGGEGGSQEGGEGGSQEGGSADNGDGPEGGGSGGEGAESSDDNRACEDADGDGFGNPDNCQDFPDGIPDEGWVDDDGDCDDSNANAYPGAAENEPDLCAEDEDDDGWGSDNPSGSGVEAGTDCDDDNANAFPGAAENQEDLCAEDEDNDGWGDANPPEGVDPGGDCDDSDSEVTPMSMGGQDCYDALELSVTRNYDIAAGGTAQFEADATGGSGSYTWVWTPADDLDDATLEDPQATPSRSRSYKVTVTDDVTGESVSAWVTVHVTDEELNLEDACGMPEGGLGLDIGGPLNGDPVWEYDYDPDGSGTIDACEIENSDPSALICDIYIHNATITGSLFRYYTGDLGSYDDNPMGTEEAIKAGDNDWLGIMWGVSEDNSSYYLFSWKRGGQAGHDGCSAGDYDVGMRVRLIQRDGDAMVCGDFSGNGARAESTELLSSGDITNGTDGWVPGVEYTFELTQTDAGSNLVINDGDTEVTSIDVADTTLTSGKFGMFAMSQAGACFNDVGSAPLDEE